MKKLLSNKAVNFTLFFILAGILLYYAFRNVDVEHILNGFKEVRYGWIGLSIIVALLAHLLRAVRWGILIEPLGKKPATANLFSAVMVGYLANIAFPRFGEVAKCGSIAKAEKIRIDSLVGTVVVERAIDMAMLLLSTLIVFLIKIDLFGSFILKRIVEPIKEKVMQINGLHIGIAVLSALLILFLLRVAIKRGLLGKTLSTKLKKTFRGTVDGLKSIARTSKLPQFVILSFLIWISYWLMTLVLLKATPITAHLGIWDAMFIMVIGSFGMVVPVQGGFGAYHIITATALGIFGITYENGLVFAIISHESQTLLLIVAGLAALSYLYLKNRTKVVSEP